MRVYVYVYGWNGWVEWMFRVYRAKEEIVAYQIGLGQKTFFVLFCFFFFQVGDDGDGGDESYMGRCGIWYMVYGGIDFQRVFKGRLEF